MKPQGFIVLAIGLFIAVIAVRGSWKSMFPWLAGVGNVDLTGSKSGGQSNTPSTQYGPGEKKNPSQCHNNVNAKTSPWPPLMGLDSNGCCPDGFSLWDIGGGAIVCRNMWNVTIGG